MVPPTKLSVKTQVAFRGVEKALAGKTRVTFAVPPTANDGVINGFVVDETPFTVAD